MRRSVSPPIRFPFRDIVNCMPVVQLSEITLIYETDKVLDGIDLSITQGEYLVILGTSGCGKTSLLRLIAGLVQPTMGKIFLAGKDVRGVAPRHRDVALVPQQAGLYPHFTIGKSIGMGIRDRIDANQRRRRIRDAAMVVELESYLDRRPDSLSGGQLRRAAVAKAIASRATVRLLDEPLSAIDANLRFQIEKDLRRLHQESPGVTIHVTHDASEAMRLADRIAVIENGKIAQQGAPASVRSCPATPGVAAILGWTPFRTMRMHRIENAWESDSGIRLSGPEATIGSHATLGYYEEDERPLRDSETSNAAKDGSADHWIDPQNKTMVDRGSLFWFLE